MAGQHLEVISISSGDSDDEIILISDEEEDGVASTKTTTTLCSIPKLTVDDNKFFPQTGHRYTNSLSTTETVFSDYEQDLQLAIALSLVDFQDKSKVDTFAASDGNWKEKGKLKQRSSKLNTQIGNRNKRMGSTLNRVVKSVMGKDTRSSEPEFGVSSVTAVCEEYPDKETSATYKTDIAGCHNEHKRPTGHYSFPLSPECSVSSSSTISSNSSSHLDLETGGNSSFVSSSSHNFPASCLPYNYEHPKKTLKFVKEEPLSDGELSDSLPDLDIDFPNLDCDLELTKDFNKDAVESSKLSRNVEKVTQNVDLKQTGNQEDLVNQDQLHMIDPNKERPSGNVCQRFSEAAYLTQSGNPKTNSVSLRPCIDDSRYLVSSEVKNKISSLLHISGKPDSIAVADSDVSNRYGDTQESSAQASTSVKRHFLDVIASSPTKKAKLVDSDSAVKNTDDTSVGNEILHRWKRNIVISLSPTLNSAPKSPILEALQGFSSSDESKQLQKSSSSMKRKRHDNYRQLPMGNYFKQNSAVSESLALTPGAKTNCKILYPSFMDDFALPDSAVYSSEPVSKFSPVELSAVDASIEEGKFFLKQTIDLTQVFALYNMPTQTVVDHIYNCGLLGSAEITRSLESFHTLSYIQRKYPSAIKITWAMISDVMNKLDLNDTLMTTDQATILRSTLALQFIVQVLRGELRAIKSMSSSICIKKCQAYKVLSSDYGMNNLNQVIQWISSVLTCGENNELRNANIGIHFDDDLVHVPKGEVTDTGQLNENLSFNELKKVLPYLQELLEIGILISTSNLDCARKLGFKMVNVFYYLPNLECKKLLLQTMTSDLLRFKLCELFMEAHCEVTDGCLEFPSEITEVTNRIFQAIPPKCQLTPPLTPSSDCFDDTVLDLSLTVSPESCEELCMLQYYAILSYFRCSKSECFKALRRRGVSDTNKYMYQLNMDDKQELQCNWECSVETLRLRALQWTADVTPATEMFLNMILSLGDA